LHIALFQPDIPQNAGTLARLGACMGVPLAIIEPAGFPTTDRAFLRAGMDYLDVAVIERHASFATFDQWRKAAGHRLVLFTTAAETAFTDFAYRADDVLLFGRESAGVPDHVHAGADARLTIPMRPGLRSLNVAVSAAMALAEALRQTGSFPSRAGKDR
jgi:tRNA (cytidine/uridine-2'-O-)-methyltransferase